MQITKKFYAKNRKEWRNWLIKNHHKSREIWLVYYKKHSGKPRVPYNDAVEEALCFGWIDSTFKTVDKDSFAQKFTPRKSRTWSRLNMERAKILIKQGLMTEAGMKHIDHREHNKKFKIPLFIIRELKKNPDAWRNFQKFPEKYKMLRTSWIAESGIKEGRKKRLDYFVRMTAKNKRFGTMQA